MKREQYLEEMLKSMSIGGVIGMICLAFVHQELKTPLELVVFWVATWMVAMYCVWSVIEWRDRGKRKAA